MHPELADLQTIFKDGQQFRVPVFQRQYVWQEQEQWVPLWEDIRDIADSCLEGSGEDDERSVHFLGVIVISQAWTAIGEPDRREVIDGQQRLITLQLILSATLHIVEKLAPCDERHPLRTLLTNYTPDNSGAHRYKIIPPVPDRSDFEVAIMAPDTISEQNDSNILEAWQHFHHEIDDWSKQNVATTHDRLYRLRVLTDAVQKRLKFVVLNLEEGDNPQAIFESMNARGALLQAADLIKNRLLLGDDRQGSNATELYHEHWAGFDTEYWLAPATIGRKNSSAIDSCLYYWLHTRSPKKFAYSHTYLQFEEILDQDANGVKGILVDIGQAARLYGHLTTVPNERAKAEADGVFRYRLMVLEAASAMPLLLWLYQRFPPDPSGKLRPELITMLGAIESFLVRGMICRVRSAPSSNFFFRVLSDLKKLTTQEAGAYVDELHRALLGSRPRTNLRWPTDEEVAQYLIYDPLNKPLKTPRLRLLLEAVEDHLRGDMTRVEELCRRDLTVEHIMPKKWGDASWPLPRRDSIIQLVEGVAQREVTGSVQEVRDALVQSFGNLTLATKALNSSMQNKSWSKKREQLQEHSVLRLTEEVVARDLWDDLAILERGQKLAELVCAIWPGPESVSA